MRLPFNNSLHITLILILFGFYHPFSDFKVNAMDEEELRKSVRRQKFEKQGLTLPTTQSAPSTGTGTGTSDDEDEASTPSGDNAERSLASTLGGSSESIPQASSTFLQAALDGPGSLSDRGDRSTISLTTPSPNHHQSSHNSPLFLYNVSERRSISSKHNNSSDGKSNNTSFTKSYTNTKKEELMKVINEAKAKLENVSHHFCHHCLL